MKKKSKAPFVEVKPGEFRRVKFDKPIGSIVCDCGTTHYIYPDMIQRLMDRRTTLTVKRKK